MNIIACVDLEWNIGNKGKLLAKIKEDMQFFKEKTLGKIVIMGRKTCESLPKFPLCNRINIVLSRSLDLTKRDIRANEEILFVKNEYDLLNILEKYDKKDIFWIGGTSIYEMAVPLCKTAYITQISCTCIADAKMPNLNIISGWSKIREKNFVTSSNIRLNFIEYENIAL